VQRGDRARPHLVGWMKRRGLPTRGCDDRCDDGFRLDLGKPCEWCATRRRDGQHRRRAVIDAVGAEMPQATPDERQAEVERRLRQEVASQAASTALRREHATRERAEQRARAGRRGQQAANVAAETAVPPRPASRCSSGVSRRSATEKRRRTR
jgi:hypothetical protein